MAETLWIIDHYSSEPQYGGYTRQYNLARGISKKGINVVVIASSFSHFKHKEFVAGDCSYAEINPGFHFVYLKTTHYQNNSEPKRFIGMISFVKQIKKYCEKIADEYGKPKWVVASSPHIMDWTAGMYVAKKYSASFNIEIRDFWPLELRSKDDSVAKKVLYKYFDYLESKAFKLANHIICTLPYGANYCLDFKKPGREKFVIIEQPLDCDRYNELAVKEWENIDEQIKAFIEDSFSCVFSGYYMGYEGVFHMLKAAKELPQVKFVFVGSGKEKEDMVAFAHDNELNNVFIGDRIDKNHIPALLTHCDVCLAYLYDNENPNMFKYGMSKNKVNEYLYSGAVTIMGFPDSRNEINESGGGFTFFPDNNRFSDLIEQVYKMDIKERQTIGEKGRKYIQQNHGIEELSQKYIRCVLEQ